MSLEAAYILPHPPLAVHEVGRGEEKKISDTLAGYREVAKRVARHDPDTIVFISPHSAYYSDWIYLAAGENAHGTLAQFRAPQVSFSLDYDTGFRDRLIECAKRHNVKAGYVEAQPRPLDHGLLVPLYFIEAKLPASNYRAVSVGGAGLPNDDLLEFGRCIARTAQNSGSVVLMVSGDLSHKLTADGPYGYDPAGPKFDRAFGDVVRSGDPAGFAVIDPAIAGPAAECGLSGFVMLAGALEEASTLEKTRFSSELLSLEGPFGVGYGVAAFEKKGE